MWHSQLISRAFDDAWLASREKVVVYGVIGTRTQPLRRDHLGYFDVKCIWEQG